MPETSTEEDIPLPRPLRAYTLLSTSGESPGNLSIVSEGSTSELYTISTGPIVDMHHSKFITMYSPSSHDSIVGGVLMEFDCDTIDLALGDSEECGKHENCIREQMNVTHDELHTTTHEFGLGLGDDPRRNFKWCSVEMHRPSTLYSAMFSGGTQSWSISKPLYGLATTHSRNHQKVAEKKDGLVTKVHEEWASNARRRCFRLIDRNAGETVAMVMRHNALVNGEIVNSDDIGDSGTRGRFYIFRDFWESGRYEEDWDRIVLLSGLAVLERADRADRK